MVKIRNEKTEQLPVRSSFRPDVVLLMQLVKTHGLRIAKAIPEPYGLVGKSNPLQEIVTSGARCHEALHATQDDDSLLISQDDRDVGACQVCLPHSP